jgi:quinol monooxygenase YgiN
MILSFRYMLTIALVSLGMNQTAAAQDGSLYVVSYVEVTPTATAQARDLIAQYAKSIRQEPGNVQSASLQRIGGQNHFAVVEIWKDKESQVAHGNASATQAFRAKLEPLLRSPYDERTHVALNVAAASKMPAPTAVYVVTHIDIFPPSQAVGLDLIRALSDESRTDEGNIRFDALQQTSRGNHITLAETWDGIRRSKPTGRMNTRSSSARRYFRSAVASTTSGFIKQSIERSSAPHRFAT